MYKNLIKQAEEAGKKSVYVAALIEKESGSIFLLHEAQSSSPAYELPKTQVQEEETIPQAIQRGVMEKTGMEIDVVEDYLGEKDIGSDRHYYFVVKVKDPEIAGKITPIDFAWTAVEESFGYPIHENLREILDVYSKKRSAI